MLSWMKMYKKSGRIWVHKFMKCNEYLNENEVFGDLKCRRLEYDCKQAMTNRIGAYPWVSSRAIDMDAVDVSFSGTPSKTTRRHRCCWTPWKGVQVSTSSQKEEWHTLVYRRTPCRQLPRRWTESDTHFQHLPHQLQHMQGHQLPRSRDLRSGVKHLSHLFRKSGTHLRLLLLLPPLLLLQACRRREERSLQNSETMPTVATLSFPPRQANDCDQSSTSQWQLFPNSNQKNHFLLSSPQYLSLPFQNQAPNSNVKCHRTVDCREYTVTECPVTKGVHQTNTQITHSFRSIIFSQIFSQNVSTPKHRKAK